MKMNNNLTSSGLNTVSFLTIHIFRKYVTYVRLLANQQNAITNFKPFQCIELLFLWWQVINKCCDKFFINKPTFLNFVPQLWKLIAQAECDFYRFAYMTVAQAHISLMRRLPSPFIKEVGRFLKFSNKGRVRFFP